MARFTAIIFAVVNCMIFETTGQPSCSPSGGAGLAGCECNFIDACDVRGRRRPDLKILKHSPNGLERYALPGRQLTYLCEGNAVAILYDCNNRIPLYAATVIQGSQLLAAPGLRPKGRDGTFRASGTGLDESFQQQENDYSNALKREIYYKTRSRRKLRDRNWHKTLNPTGGDKAVVAMHRGHMIASQYGIGDYAKKVKTFVYTNAVPQFGVFNSGPWKTCESRLIRWGQVYCLLEGAREVRNVQMFIVVGAIPSTLKGPSETRFFGSGGFSDYQDTSFRVNVPTEMWTASCCTYQYTKAGRTYSLTKSTAFWRENVPGKYECERVDVDSLEDKLTPKGETRINLFPSSKECKNSDSYERLP